MQRQVAQARERRRHQHELALRESYFRSLIDRAPVMLWTTDANGDCTYLSQQWYDYTGRTPAQDLGLGWLENIHPDDLAGAAAIFEAASREQRPFALDYRARRHDGVYRWFIDTGTPRVDQDGKPNGFVGTVVDVHDRTMLQQALTEKNRMQSEFLFTLAHELRNPLAPIRTGLELMRIRPTAENAGKVQTMIQRQVDHMVHLVDDLLDVARLSEGKVELKRSQVMLAEIVRDAVEMSMPLVQAGNHRLELHLPDAGTLLYV
ncbi:MAG: PAS domain-containing sensor histidine kinase, partial [Telluria sp.]